MNFWDRVKIFFWRVGAQFTLRWGLYYPWSRVVRWIAQHKHRNGVPMLFQYESYEQIREMAKDWKWRADTWKVGWDSISYPSHFQHMIDTDFKAGSSDCDDFSVYLGTVMQRLEKDGGGLLETWKATSFEVIAIISWSKKYGFKGHNVCLIKLQDKLDPAKQQYAHVSNWSNGTIQMVGRHNGHMPMIEIEDVVRDVCVSMSGKDCINGAWSICDLSCKWTGKSGRIKI